MGDHPADHRYEYEAGEQYAASEEEISNAFWDVVAVVGHSQRNAESQRAAAGRKAADSQAPYQPSRRTVPTTEAKSMLIIHHNARDK